MRTAVALLALLFVAAMFASTVPHGSALWAVLTGLVVALFLAAIIRVHAVVNAPKAER